MKNIYCFCVALCLSLVFSQNINAKEIKKNETNGSINLTILTTAIGSEPSTNVPIDLIEFWKIIEIEKENHTFRIVPKVICLRIDQDKESEFKPIQPAESVTIRLRKIIGSWTEKNERIRLLDDIGSQNIGETFSAKLASKRSESELAKIICDRSKENNYRGFLIYNIASVDSKPKKNIIDQTKNEAGCSGIDFHDTKSILEYIKKDVVNSDQSILSYNYLIAYKIKPSEISEPTKISIPAGGKFKGPNDEKEWWHIGFSDYGFTYKDAKEILSTNKDGWALPSIDDLKNCTPMGNFKVREDIAYWTSDKAKNGNPYGFCFGKNGGQCNENEKSFKEFDETDSLGTIFVRTVK